MNVSSKTVFVLLLPLIFLFGCSSMGLDQVLPDKQVEYKREVVADKHLEVPPDLTSSRIDTRIPGLYAGDGTTYSEYASVKQAKQGGSSRPVNRDVLPEYSDIRMQREGKDRWLVIKAPVDVVWDRLMDFWQENGILLSQQDPAIGMMETDWLEDSNDVKNDFITDAIRGVFKGAYSSAKRDRYRIRLEQGAEPGTTELYLVHFGMEQEFATGSTNEDEQVYWKIRERDPGLEVMMLRKIMVFLGLSEAEAKAAVAAEREVKGIQSRLVKGADAVSLTLSEPFARAWRVVGLALDRVGFVVEDRNRSKGVYYVRYNDPSAGSESKGWLSGLAFWRNDSKINKAALYQVQLNAADDVTRVQVHDAEGKVLASDTALRILTLIKEQLQ